MKHTQKMILVPAEITEKTKPIDPILSSLDSEMQKILSSKHLPSELKLIKYNQVLRRHSKLQEKKRQPYELSMIEQQNAISDNEILETLPETRHGSAKLLLHYVRTDPNIQIEDNGEIVVHGQKVHGSNIVDLVNDFSRQYKSRPPAVGAEELAKALKRSNIPQESIGNKTRWSTYFTGNNNNDSMDASWEE